MCNINKIMQSIKNIGITNYLCGKNRYKGILQIIILCACLMTCIIHHLSIFVGLTFFIFQFLCVFAQGKLFLSGMKIHFPNELAGTAFCYGVGLIFLIPEYYFFEFLHIGKCAFVAWVLVGLGLLNYYKKKIMVDKQTYYKQDTDDSLLIQEDDASWGWKICLFFLFLIYVVDFFAVSMVTTIPNENGANGYYVDWLFWIGNAISFQKGLPVQVFRVVGENFRYHYFSSIVIAQISRMTGIDVLIVGFYLSYIIVSIILVFGTFILLSRFTNRKVLLAGAIVLIFFTGDRGGVTTDWHYFFCPFGYDYGMAMGILTIYFLFFMHSHDMKNRDIFFSSFLLAATTGFKAPIAVVVLLGMGIEGLWLLYQKRIKKALLAGSVWLGAFVCVYYVFIMSHKRNIARTYYGIRQAFAENSYGIDIYMKISQILPFPSRLVKIFAFFISVITINRAIMICYIIASLIYVFNKKILKYELVVLFFMANSGIYMTLSILMSGSSQMYFAMAALPYAVCFSLPAIEYFIYSKECRGKIFAITAIIYTVAFGVGYWERSFQKMAWQGINTIQGNLTYENYENEFVNSSRYYITSGQMEGYQWIKENTEEDCLIASNFGRGNMAMGVFTERFLWNDGTYGDYWIDEVERRNDIVGMLNNSESFHEGINALKKEGIAYYIEDAQSQENSLADSVLKKIYSNNDMAVYRIE